MAAGGFLLGAAGIWKAFETGILVSGIYILFFMFMGKLRRNSEIALGPFLCLGILLVWLN